MTIVLSEIRQRLKSRVETVADSRTFYKILLCLLNTNKTIDSSYSSQLVIVRITENQLLNHIIIVKVH